MIEKIKEDIIELTQKLQQIQIQITQLIAQSERYKGALAELDYLLRLVGEEDDNKSN